MGIGGERVPYSSLTPDRDYVPYSVGLRRIKGGCNQALRASGAQRRSREGTAPSLYQNERA